MSDPVIRKKDFIKLKSLFLHTDRSQVSVKLVEPGRIEVVRDPGPTSCVQGRRGHPINSSTIQLELVELSGIEPLTSCVQGRRSPS